MIYHFHEQATNLCSLVPDEVGLEFIGVSDSAARVVNLALAAAQDRDVSVLITGENGTGKEIIARLIHLASERAGAPFVPVNSAAIPESLLESEFFGHVKGSFTGAHDSKKGHFEQANGGTLFLDEIADMPTQLQAKLLRALEQKVIKKVGGVREISLDLRVISATNQDVLHLIDENRFRRDLFHRLNTIEINIPPLRERKEDIEPLTRWFMSSFAEKKGLDSPELKPEWFEQLYNYDFPGNVRELRNLVERALILSGMGSSDSLKLFPGHTGTRRHMTLAPEVEKIREALIDADMNQNVAAQNLGISRDALIRRMKKYHITISKQVLVEAQ